MGFTKYVCYYLFIFSETNKLHTFYNVNNYDSIFLFLKVHISWKTEYDGSVKFKKVL